jgi:hypothetical protein
MADKRSERNSVVVEQELRRQAARIFPKLANDAGYLEKLSGHPGGTASVFGVFSRRNNFRRYILSVEENVVDGLKKRGWLEQADGRIVLAEEGLLWLRRHLAGAEPFLEQHQLRETSSREINGTYRPVIVNHGESPLGWLRRRKDRNGIPLIDAQQFEAGERLRAEFERGQLSPDITSHWGAAASSRRGRRAAPAGVAGLQDNVLAARQRVIKALEAVGPELSGVLLDICCHLQGLSDAEKSRGWPQRSGKVILQIALSRLARYYGLIRDQNSTNSSGLKIRHWGTENFKPTLDEWR